MSKGGATNSKVGGGQCIGMWVGQYRKNTDIWKRWGYMTPPPCFYGGVASVYERFKAVWTHEGSIRVTTLSRRKLRQESEAHINVNGEKESGPWGQNEWTWRMVRIMEMGKIKGREDYAR